MNNNQFAPAIAALLLSTAMACAQWEQRAPTTFPSARRGAAMTYAPSVSGLLLFGGTGNPAPNNETWSYDGNDWNLLTPANSPAGRQEMEMVFDTIRGVAVMYGGINAFVPGSTGETWEFDGSNWMQVPTAATPYAIYRQGMCYDLLRGKVVSVGGVGGGTFGFPSNETWEYDGVNWTNMTTSPNPGAIDRPAMCYHIGIGKAVLFGGAFASTIYDATWTYDGIGWTQVAITGSKPAARQAAKMVYDSVRNVCVLTGGMTASTIYDDTWEFDGATWSQQPTVTQPARDHSLAFLPTTRQVVKFGGFAAVPNTLSDQTWEFGARFRAYGVGCPGSNGTPTLSMPDAGRIGGNYILDVTNAAPLLAVFVIGLSEEPGVALDSIGMTGCSAYSTPDLLISAVPVAGTASLTWSPVTAVVGNRFYAQALCLDPGANPAWLTASNGVANTFGF